MPARRFHRLALPLLAVLASLAMLAFGRPAAAGTVVLESWRVDDRALWETVLIPAFERKHPGITVKYLTTAPTAYDASLATRLAKGEAGDVIACRPFDASLALYRKGYLDKLNGLPGLAHFAPQARLAWQTDDGREVFCLPVASVIHGFFYNKKIFGKLGLRAPTDAEDFIKLLDKVSRHGATTPLALGTAEQWEATQILFTGIGPSWWRGEEGRRALVAGKARFTDPRFLAVFDFESRLAPYLPADAASRGYTDSQLLFARGQAAVYPAGSWDIAYFNKVPGLEFGVFPPPPAHAGERCQISDHMDIGAGVNRHARNKADAYRLLDWMATQEFADLYTNRAVGFFSLSTHLIAIEDPLARQMAAWRDRCGTSFRVNAQFLNRGQPALEQELWKVNAAILGAGLRPRDAARRLQQNLDRWYRPPPDRIHTATR